MTPERESGGAPSGPPWHPLVRIALFLVLFLVLEVAVAAIVEGLWSLAAGSAPVLEPPTGTPVTGGYLLLFYVCLAPLLLPLTAMFLRRFDGRAVASLGARLPAGGWAAVARQAVAVGLGAAALLGAWLGGVAAFGRVGSARLAAGFEAGTAWLPGPAGGSALLALTLLGFLIGGVVEEWVFRGYVYRALRERWSWAGAAGASSLVFALFHLLNPGFEPAALANTLLLGVALAALVEGTGSLAASALAHGTWNFLMGSVLSVPVSGLEVSRLLDLEIAGHPALTGGGYGPEGSWLLTALLVPLVLALALWADRRAARHSP